VFGNSSGAIVGLEVLIHHPSSVRRLIAHEPPAVRQLADGRQWLDFLASIYDSYRQSGMAPAMKEFSARMVAGPGRQIIGGGPKSEFFVANSTYWFEHEVRQYPAITLDLDALRRHAGRSCWRSGVNRAGSRVTKPAPRWVTSSAASSSKCPAATWVTSHEPLISHVRCDPASPAQASRTGNNVPRPCRPPVTGEARARPDHQAETEATAVIGG